MADPTVEAFTLVFRFLNESIKTRKSLNCLAGAHALDSESRTRFGGDEEGGFSRVERNKHPREVELAWFGHVAAAHGPRREELLLMQCEDHRNVRRGTPRSVTVGDPNSN